MNRLMDGHLWWYVARATGIVSWVALAASGALGAVLSARLLRRRGAPAWATDVHRFLGGLAVIMLMVHLGSLIADSYVHFDLVDLLVPGAASWRTGAVAWGVVAVWLIVAVELTSLAMRRLPRRRWKQVHLLSYLGLWAATIHGATAGTDTRNLVWVGVSLVVIATVSATTLARLLLGLPTPVTTAESRLPNASEVG